MGTIYNNSLNFGTKDLSGMMSTLVAKQPKFISMFTPVDAAINTKHGWFEDQITPRSVTAVTSTATTTLYLGAADYATMKVGVILRDQVDTQTWIVTSLNGTDNVTVAINAANDSSATAVVDGHVYDIVSLAQAQGSSNGDGDSTARVVADNYNYTQIMREEAILTGTAIAMQTDDGIENNMSAQEAAHLQQMVYQMNRMALYGKRVAPTSAIKGQAGGLYTFGATLENIASGTYKLSSSIVNDAVELCMTAGSTPDTILCGIAQARYLSAENSANLQVILNDTTSGQFVGQVRNDVSGNFLKIIADHDIIDSEAWVIDSTGLGVTYLGNRGPQSWDTTSDGFDGMKRSILAEPTFVFKNGAQRLCRISALGSADPV